MRVLAVRDDGAQLIGEPELSCAFLKTKGGSSVMPVASAMARGYWDEPRGFFGEVSLPEEVEEKVRQASAEYSAQDGLQPGEMLGWLHGPAGRTSLARSCHT